MKYTLTLFTFLLAPLAVLAQAKPEVANATKAAKLAWESVPAAKRRGDLRNWQSTSENFSETGFYPRVGIPRAVVSIFFEISRQTNNAPAVWCYDSRRSRTQ